MKCKHCRKPIAPECDHPKAAPDECPSCYLWGPRGKDDRAPERGIDGDFSEDMKSML